MHPNAKFQLTEAAEMAAIVREAGFGTLVVETGDGLRSAHVPVLIDGDRARFHLSRRNAVFAAAEAGCEALLLVDGPHAYVSADWYGLDDRVPTWNYVAVELNGRVSAIGEEALVRLLDDLSAENEARLAPKPAWTRAAMSPGRFEGLVRAIGGFEMRIAAWRGTAKIDQDKPAAVRERIAAALEAQGEAAMARLMRRG